MSAAFDKAVAIVKGLPSDGPMKPTQDQQLEVSPESEQRKRRRHFAAVRLRARSDVFELAVVL